MVAADIKPSPVALLCICALVAGCSAAQSGTETAKWYQTAIGYEIFVRSFYDSDGDGIGDLKGVTQKLDYLNDGKPGQGDDLEVSLIWLMPISPSPSYHGYDVTDYRAIEPDYGTMADFTELVEQAHARGIRVIVDFVMNHTSSEHPWFVDASNPASPSDPASNPASPSRPTSAHRSWYVWSDKEMYWKQPWSSGNTWHELSGAWYYGLFWSGMPDLNYEEPAVRAEMTEVARFWLDAGADGFRLDAVRYLIEDGPGDGMQDTLPTIDFWRDFSADLHSTHPDVLLVGEAWASNEVASKYHVEGDGLNMTFDFDLMEAIVAGLIAGDLSDVERSLAARPSQFPPEAALGTFLSNHDILRLSARLKGNYAQARLAAMLLMALPGTPFVYYGEEIGMDNGPTLDDKHKRTPMQWDGTENAGFTSGKPWLAVNDGFDKLNVAAQQADPESLLSLYRALIRLRTSTPALSQGGFTPLATTSAPALGQGDSAPRTETSDAAASDPSAADASGQTVGLWAFLRDHPSGDILCVVNPTDVTALAAQVSTPSGVVPTGDVPPHSLVLFSLSASSRQPQQLLSEIPLSP